MDAHIYWHHNDGFVLSQSAPPPGSPWLWSPHLLLLAYCSLHYLSMYSVRLTRLISFTFQQSLCRNPTGSFPDTLEKRHEITGQPRQIIPQRLYYTRQAKSIVLCLLAFPTFGYLV